MILLTGVAPRLAIIVAAMMVAWATPSRAASPEPGDATYHALRYDDDFSSLAPGPANHGSANQGPANPDVWDPIKYVPLATGPYGPSYLSFGGEVRERFESYLNPNFGIKAPDANAYLLQRVLLDLDAHVTNYARFFAQLGGFERLGNRGLASTTDIDHLDLMQAFVDLRIPSPLADSPVIRIGREELLFGYQRLVAVREGPNVRRDFDGFRLIDRWNDVLVNLIAVRPVNDNTGVFDDHTNQRQSLWGAYLTVPLGDGANADLYELNYENETARFRNQTGEEHRETLGVRLFGARDGFDWNAEVALQAGRFRGHDIRADMFAAVGGYTFALPWLPRLGLEMNYASGDNSRSSSIGTFNAMYPRLPYFAETSLLVPANVYDVHPVLSVRPDSDLLATFGVDMLWRASETDGLYGSGLVQYANTVKASSARVGTEFSADLRWRYDQHLQFGAIAAEFLAGPAVQEAFGKSVTFFVLFATYRF